MSAAERIKASCVLSSTGKIFLSSLLLIKQLIVFNRYIVMSLACMLAKWLQLCPTLCDSMDCSLPDSSVHGVLRA